MVPNRFSLLGLLTLSVLALLIFSLSAGIDTPTVEAAARATRTPRPTRTPIPTATPVAPPTATPGSNPNVPGTWKAVNSPNVNNRSNKLNGLALVSANDIWAVGVHQSSNASNQQTLTLRWNGSSWNTVASPNPDPNRNHLMGVAAVSANDVWAVGVSGGTTGPNWTSLILHWDGSSWTNVPAPSIGTTGTVELRGVAAVAANDVWAVGAFSTPATNWWNQSYIIHWDGSAWSSVPAPAIGSTTELNGVFALASNDVWAVGRALESNWRTVILHWNGSTWSRVSSPNLGSAGNNLNGIGGASANDLWAVGSANNGNSTLTLRWNGSAWNLVSSPNGTQPGINRSVLYGVKAVAANDVWAVGAQASSSVGGAGQPIYIGYALIEHWDGSAWSVVSAAPLPGTGEDGELRGVVAAAANDVWAGGFFYEGALSTQAFRTLTQRYTVP